MSIASWVYDHAPKSVQDWMDSREQQRAADAQYDAAHPVNERNPDQPRPLTPEQPKQDDAISKQMASLPFDYDEADMRRHFEKEASRGVTPEQTAQKLEEAFEAHIKEPVEHIRSSEMIRNFDGSGTEINYSIGKSDTGFHYAINEWPTVGPDIEGQWSQPFPTAEKAEAVAKTEVHLATIDDYPTQASWDPYTHSPDGHEVKSLGRGEWNTSMDGRAETKLTIGQSEAGFHYSLVANENGGEWSHAYRTRDIAEQAGGAAEARALGDGIISPNPRRQKALDAQERVTDRGDAAAYLNTAAYTTKLAIEAQDPDRRGRLTQGARVWLERAIDERHGRDIDDPTPRPERSQTPADVRPVQRAAVFDATPQLGYLEPEQRANISARQGLTEMEHRAAQTPSASADELVSRLRQRRSHERSHGRSL